MWVKNKFNFILAYLPRLFVFGTLIFSPLIVTGCNSTPNYQTQIIDGNKTPLGNEKIAGSQEYTTTATTTVDWTVVPTNGSKLPSGISMESNMLTWDGTLNPNDYNLTINCKAINYIDTTYSIILTITQTVEITQMSANPYLTNPNSSVYYGPQAHTIGDRLLKLKDFSEANGNITHYVVTENITFGFLVDPNMECYIGAINGATITCEQDSNTNVGVIVGTVDEACTGFYNKSLTIDSNVVFNIKSNYATAINYGVFFNSVNSETTQIINGTFNISSNSSHICGVYFIAADSGSTQIINGTFIISSVYASFSTVVYGATFGTCAIGSTQIINGTFNIFSSFLATGILIVSAHGSSTINGVFTISAIKSTGVEVDTTSALLTINGTFNVSSTSLDAYGVLITNVASGSTQIINGSFSVSSTLLSAWGVAFSGGFTKATLEINGVFVVCAAVDGYGVDLQDNYFFGDMGNIIINGTFTLWSDSGDVYGFAFRHIPQHHSYCVKMNDTHFFSNDEPTKNGEWSATDQNSNYPSWNGEYFHDNFVANNGQLVGDSSLTVKNIVNKLPNPDFLIKVIDTASIADSKITFNFTYQKCLDDYTKSGNCGRNAKMWLKSIINLIYLA